MIEQLTGLWVFLGTSISFLIMFWIVSYYLYFPVKKFLRERHQQIQHNIDSAASNNTRAERNYEKSESILNDANNKKIILLQEAEKSANDERNNIINEAKVVASDIVDKASLSAEREADKIKKDIEKELTNIAILAAEKIVKKNIDKKTNSQLVEELIENIK